MEKREPRKKARQTHMKKGGLETMIEKEEYESAREPRILTIDIENTPLIGYSWKKWDTNLIEIIDQSKILSYSVKWLKGKQTTKGLPDYKGYKKGSLDDEALIRDVYDFIDEADIIVGQNSINFDMKKLNARFLHYGLPPPSPYKQVDTLREARKLMNLPSYKLDELGDYLGLGNKLKHEGFALWTKCMTGDEKAWKKMLRYNAQDVRLTEKLYLRLRPYMKTHPNVGEHMEACVCPKCGGEDLQMRGYARTTANVYHRFQCNGCGGWGRSSVSDHKYKTNRNQ